MEGTHAFRQKKICHRKSSLHASGIPKHHAQGQMQQANIAQVSQQSPPPPAIEIAMNDSFLLILSDLTAADVTILLPRSLAMQTECSSATLRELNTRKTTNRVAVPMIKVIPVIGSYRVKRTAERYPWTNESLISNLAIGRI